MSSKKVKMPEADRVGFWQRRKHVIMPAKKGKGAYKRNKKACSFSN